MTLLRKENQQGRWEVGKAWLRLQVRVVLEVDAKRPDWWVALGLQPQEQDWRRMAEGRPWRQEQQAPPQMALLQTQLVAMVVIQQQQQQQEQVEMGRKRGEGKMQEAWGARPWWRWAAAVVAVAAKVAGCVAAVAAWSQGPSLRT